jgi:16S rRNA (guanine(966)-N(2))-methyltransferase RsmD
LRIISGSARGTHLTTFSGKTIRPTPDRVREAVFSILTSRLDSLAGCKVLDLYAGTGAMAIEALSRGAAAAWLVDKGEQAARIIPSNLKACHMLERAQYLHMPVAAAIARLAAQRPFDLISLDPPYHQGLVPQTLQAISDLQLLAPTGLVVAEAASSDAVAAEYGTLERIVERRYGTVAVHLFANRQSEA